MIDRKELARLAKMELSKRDFWEYCKFVAPDFYKEDRAFLRDLCETLQRFYQSDKKILVINMPPRHGKSRTATLLVQWLFGQDPKSKVMTGSYNETLSSTFAKQVRDKIAEEPTMGLTVYSDIFPNTRIKKGEASAAKWALHGSEQTNYLATSPTGTATGFGCFVGETRILTPYGEKTIEEIYNDKTCNQVLTYDLKNGKIRCNLIRAKRRLSSNEIVKVKTTGGKEIVCTSDHRFYTKEQGWVRADTLRAGDTVITADNRIDLRTVRETIHAKAVRSAKSIEKWLYSHVLLKRMFNCNNQRKSVAGGMRGVRETDKCASQILLERVQSESSTARLARHNLPDMREGVQTPLAQDSLLLNEVQEQSAFSAYDRARQFTLQIWHKLQQSVSRCKAACFGKRRAPLSDVWVCRSSSAEQEIWYNNQFESASYQRKCAGQFVGKLGDALSRMSHKVAQNEKIESVEVVAGSRFVYDIQVDKDENFFANGVLVHNCTIMIIDDLIKNVEEAYNELTLQKQVDWFNNTMLSRTETGFKLIIIMTRWATGDLAGYILENFKDVEHINYKAVQDDGSMLCPDILSLEDYEFKTKNMNIDIVKANYQQEPIDIKGRLYSSFKTYAGQLPEFKEIRNYTDTADTGDDYLCSINYGVTFDKEAYVLDVLYTKEPMEVTEPAMARMLVQREVNVADIESNNGGRGFSRAVERIVKTEYQSNKTIFRPFTQKKNKIARILTNATWVMEHVYFPANWRDRFPEYYQAMMKYQREGKNAHDDAQDATTGIAEKVGSRPRISFD